MMSHRPRGYQWSSLGHYKVVSTMWFSVEQLRTLQSSIDHVVLSGATQDIAKSYRSHGSQWSSSLQSRIDHVVLSVAVQDIAKSYRPHESQWSSLGHYKVVSSTWLSVEQLGTLQSRIVHVVLSGTAQDITKSYKPCGSQSSSVGNCDVAPTTRFSILLPSHTYYIVLNGFVLDIAKWQRPRDSK